MAKKTTGKRPPINTAASQVATVAAVLSGSLQPPAGMKLRKIDLPYWEDVMDARAKQLWTKSDLRIAVNLVRAMADTERLQMAIQREGEVHRLPDGKRVKNPKIELVDMYVKRTQSLARMLHVHAEASIGRAANSGKARAAEKEAEENLKDVPAPLEMAHDDLIPTRRH